MHIHLGKFKIVPALGATWGNAVASCPTEMQDGKRLLVQRDCRGGCWSCSAWSLQENISSLQEEPMTKDSWQLFSTSDCFCFSLFSFLMTLWMKWNRNFASYSNRNSSTFQNNFYGPFTTSAVCRGAPEGLARVTPKASRWDVFFWLCPAVSSNSKLASSLREEAWGSQLAGGIHLQRGAHDDEEVGQREVCQVLEEMARKLLPKKHYVRLDHARTGGTLRNLALHYGWLVGQGETGQSYHPLISDEIQLPFCSF